MKKLQKSNKYYNINNTTIYLGKKNLINSYISNFEKWGKDENHNILYISGYFGSGKSTTALSLAKDNDKVIHIDAYSEPTSGGTATIRNQDFDSYLDKFVPKWKQMTNATKMGRNGMMKRHSKEYWDTVDSFREALEEYGKLQFSKGNRVIAEGVQIADDWLVNDKQYYIGKPIVILNTNPILSICRAFERDERGNLITGLKSLESAKDYILWYSNTCKKLNKLIKVTKAKRIPKLAKNYFKQNV